MLEHRPRVWLEYKAYKDNQANVKTAYDLFSKASQDKQHILKLHEMSVEPLSINGPAGTGKSYIANPFIYAFVNRSRRSGDLNEGQKPMVKFVTLSKDLAAGFVRDHEEFMDGRELPHSVGGATCRRVVDAFDQHRLGTLASPSQGLFKANSYRKQICLHALKR